MPRANLADAEGRVTKRDRPQDGPSLYLPYARTEKIGSPNGIRTRVLTLRGLRPRPLVDGASTFWLGNLDSNQDCLIQSQVSCHWTIPQISERRQGGRGEYITINPEFGKGVF